jgi:hypothetical protein
MAPSSALWPGERRGDNFRQWCRKFGGNFARKLHQRRAKPGDIWHLDEVFLKMNGKLHYLWRAVDQHGVVLHILVQNRRNVTAAKRFFKRLLAGLTITRTELIQAVKLSDGWGPPHLMALTLQAVFRLALRQAEGLIGVRGSAADHSPARIGSSRLSGLGLLAAG